MQFEQGGLNWLCNRASRETIVQPGAGGWDSFGKYLGRLRTYVNTITILHSNIMDHFRN